MTAPALAFLRTFKRMGVAPVAAYVAMSLASALAGSLSAMLLVPLVQPGHALVLGHVTLGVHAGIGACAALFVSMTVAFALLRWRAARLATRLAGRYGLDLRRAVHARLIGASLAAMADSSSAEIANVLTYNVEIITQGFNAMLQLLVAGMTAAISLGLAFWVSPPLALAAPLLAILALLASRLNSREQAAVSRRYVANLTRLFWLSEDFPRRLRHVRSFGREEAEKAGYGAIAAQLAQGYQQQLDLIASGRLMLELLAAVGMGVVFVLAYGLRGVGQAQLIAVCLLLGRLLPYLLSTRQNLQQWHSAIPAWELWQRYMQLPAAPTTVQPVRPMHAGVTLHIDHLRLAPPLAARDVRGLTLSPGTLTLVFGDSGIGKSSLIDVLAGMTPPAAFSARAGDDAIDFEAYRQRVRHGAYVSQSVRPWQLSIRDCLRWAAPEATDAMLRSVLADVGLSRRLAGTDGDWSTVLEHSPGRLSGGELQRLLLAQVMLRQPSVALLDEATSALDAASEMAVLRALKRRLPHTIMIVVSHRRGVAAVADQCLAIGGDRRATVRRGEAGTRSWRGRYREESEMRDP